MLPWTGLFTAVADITEERYQFHCSDITLRYQHHCILWLKTVVINIKAFGLEMTIRHLRIRLFVFRSDLSSLVSQEM